LFCIGLFDNYIVTFILFYCLSRIIRYSFRNHGVVCKHS